MNERFLEDAEAARNALAAIGCIWDGKTCVLEMKAQNFQWRQMEWPGFYFEMLCRQLLPEYGFTIPGDRIGRITFDGKRSANWDFKAHAIKSHEHLCILNDATAMDQSIARNGWHGLIIALLDVDYNDTDRSFQHWHTELKGGLSTYERLRIKRTAISRYRKTRASVAEILFVGVNAQSKSNLRIYGQGRNSNGNPRATKYMIDLEHVHRFPLVQWEPPAQS